MDKIVTGVPHTDKEGHLVNNSQLSVQRNIFSKKIAYCTQNSRTIDQTSDPGFGKNKYISKSARLNQNQTCLKKKLVVLTLVAGWLLMTRVMTDQTRAINHIRPQIHTTNNDSTDRLESNIFCELNPCQNCSFPMCQKSISCSRVC